MVKMAENNISENAGNIAKIAKGSVVAIILTIILLIVFSTILTYSSLGENTINIGTIIITGISILVGSGISTSNIKKNGAINGGAVGLIYISSIYLISSIITMNFSFNKYSIIMIISSIMAGSLGGIIGVNKK